MKTIVILGVIVLATFTIFVWFVRLTKQPKQNLKVVHRKEDHDPLFV